eukprot:gene32433-31042_t
MPFNNKRTAMMRIVPREDSTIVRAHSRRIFRRQSSKVSTDGKKYGKMFPPSLQLEQVMSETDLVISEEQASADELCCMGSPRASSQGTPLAAVVDNADTAYAKQLQEQYRQKQQLKKLQAEVAKQAATQAATGPVPMSSREDFDSNAYGQKLLEHSRHKKMLKKHLNMKSTWTPKDPLVTAEGSAGEGARNCKSICWSRRKHLLVTAVRANAAPSHSPIPVPQLTPASLNTLSHCPPRAPLLTACDAFELTEVYGLAAWAIRGCGGWCETE